MPDQITIDWTTAEVSGDQLVVELKEKAPKQWRDAFEHAGRLLAHGSPTLSVSAKRGVVKVEPIGSDDADRVRHLVESAVLEANATLVDQADLYGTGDDHDAADESANDEPEQSPDAELTDRFRSFAEPADEVG